VGERPKPAGAKSRAFSPFVACLEAEKTRKKAEKSGKLAPESNLFKALRRNPGKKV